MTANAPREETGSVLGHPEGTCFLLFPQAPVLSAFRQPERLRLLATRSVEPGPSDALSYVADAIGKSTPYEFPYLPPWTGPVHPPVRPGPHGHFDHLVPGSREFGAAHLFGAVRFAMDVWERYFGRRIPWFFRRDLPRLELVPFLDWDNAHSGYGFVETGWERNRDGAVLRFALSMDTIGHEIGHSILFSEVGIPIGIHRTAEFLAFHEAAADLMSLVCVAQFNAVLDDALSKTKGSIYLENEINRIGELSETEQIRVVSNDLKMSDVADIWLDAEGQWHDASGRGRHAHDLSLPLSGAIFDVIVEIYQEILVERSLIPPWLDRLSRSGERDPHRIEAARAGFAQAYAGRHHAFKEALVYARDYTGFALARLCEDIWPGDLAFSGVGAALLAADREMSGGRFKGVIDDCFAWRGVTLASALTQPPRHADLTTLRHL